MIDRRTRDFFKGIWPALGLGDFREFSKLPEDEQARLIPPAIAKLTESQSLAFRDLLAQLVRGNAKDEIVSYIRYLGLDFHPELHHKVLLDGLERVERREVERGLLVEMPPGSGKSTYTSVIYPAWYLGRNPTHSLIACSHTEELTVRFGRRARNHYATEAHKKIFGVGVSKDSGAAGRWDTAAGGEYYAVGFNGSVTGRRADILLIDDPVKGREEADSQRIRDKTWDIYINDLLTRLKPEGRQILVTCMTGDTPVLMSDGTERSLEGVRPGDMVATYEDGRISSSEVLNWKNQGPDFTYEIRMMSGTTVRANERHPFLVASDGEPRWLRMRDLTTGDEIIRAMRRAEPGLASNAQRKIANGQLGAKACACPTTTNAPGPQAIGLRLSILPLDKPPVLNIATAFGPENISAFSMLKAGDAPFVENSRQRPTRALIGTANSVSITVTRPERLEGSSVTTAILSSDMERPSECCSGPLDMFEITRDEIVSIKPCGFEEVFDLQVERTGNFIANGLVSHNTRWHEDDLAGRILEMEGSRWDRIRLPMEAQANDILGRKPGERLWPEWFTEEMVRDAKRDSRAWNALYQQEPAGTDGDFFKRDWFRDYDIAPNPTNLRIYAASDYAVTEKAGDFTEHAIFGMDFNRNIYVLDWWSGQETAKTWIEVQCDLIIKWKPVKWFGEAGPIRRAIEPFLLQRMSERGAFCPIEWLPSIHDKPTRLRAFQGMCDQGKVWFPKRGADWRSDVIGQLLRFPVGMHDDKVDACSLLGRGLEYVNAPEAANNIVNLQTHYNRGYESAKRRFGSGRNRHEYNKGMGRHA